MLIVLFSCKKDDEFDFALIQTGDVTDIDSTGATFHARISDLSNSDILKYGFVWSTESNPEIHNSEKYIITGSPSVGFISEKISTTLRDTIIYYVRAFMQNDNYITYGKEVTFTSLGSSAPDISGFTFKSGTNIDTIIIYGHNFSYLDNIVHFNETKGNVLKATQDSLITILPDTIYHNLEKISVTVSGNKTEYNTIFNNMSESSFTISEKNETFGNYITITSNEINYTKGSLRVLFNNIISKTIYLDNKNIRVQIPENLDKRTPNITVISERNRSVIHNQFSLAALEILDFNPKVILTGKKVTLTGYNFSPIPENNIIQIGGIPAKVVNASVNELEVILPLQDKGIYPSRNVNISLEVIGESETFDETILINDKWFRLSDYPGSKTNYANCFVANNNAYVGLNDTKELWRFNPDTHQWTKMNDFPGVSRSTGTGFCIDNKIYFGTGLSDRQDLTDFWSYNIFANSWEQLTDISFDARHGATGYTVNDNGYISGGVIYSFASYPHPFEDTWEYYPTTDTWEEKSSFGELQWGGVDGFADAGAITIGETVFYGLGWNRIYDPPPPGSSERVFTFKPTENYVWEQIQYFPIERGGRPIAFNLNNTPYFYTNDVIYGYNGNTWNKLEHKILSDITGGIGFSVSGKVYIGLGNSKAIWEYDPTR